MNRPNVLLICTIRLPGQRRWVIPMATWVVQDLLESCIGIWRWLDRFHFRWKKDLNRTLPQIDFALQDVPRLFAALRAAGSFHLVDVKSGEVDVSVRLI
ncbi:MAG: hypothetical protein ACOX18_08070 [Bacillota bacterium]|jgi:hypothetical protein